MEEIMKALHDVVESGKVRYIGASSVFAWEFQMLQNIAEKNRWTKFISMQNYYNLLVCAPHPHSTPPCTALNPASQMKEKEKTNPPQYREEEREMIPYCKATGVGIIPWSPLARGVLTRPFDSRETVRENTDDFLKYSRKQESDTDKVITGRVEEIAKKHGVSMAIVATAWVLSKGASPILGLGSVDRIDEAVKALSFKLTEEETTYLEEAYLPKVPVGIVV